MKTVQEIDLEIKRVKGNAAIKIALLWLGVFAIWYGLYVASLA